MSISSVLGEAIERAQNVTSRRPLADEVILALREVGYVVVPREPTETMLNGARDWSVAKNGRGVGNDQASGCWRAMVEAAE